MNTFSSPTTSAFSPARQMSMQPWDVSASEKSTSDGFFAQLDTQNKGVIEGEVAVPFMLQSQLDEGVLASIWYVPRRPMHHIHTDIRTGTWQIYDMKAS